MAFACASTSGMLGRAASRPSSRATCWTFSISEAVEDSEVPAQLPGCEAGLVSNIAMGRLRFLLAVH
eukprot:CAMPEP_0119311348 /NCGR_PEP_ID=MMETSP1333-20130426/22072_2 /TAXON_ID=418940 /ORGANISM="Scyphosphaera apsteinii, Strain RCC1455" /LENGTH=66 /DNA_ID=CAMNT_0007315699 /DNA_START=280 /DNA_END=477 /DNA_ORIENTATION=-